MKCQFATIEAMISLSVIGSALALAYLMVNGSNSAHYSNLKSLNSNIAIYDFAEQLNTNKSLQSCMASNTENIFDNCSSAYTWLYTNTYHLSSMLILDGNYISGNVGNSSYKACMQQSSTASVICVITS